LFNKTKCTSNMQKNCSKIIIHWIVSSFKITKKRNLNILCPTPNSNAMYNSNVKYIVKVVWNYMIDREFTMKTLCFNKEKFILKKIIKKFVEWKALVWCKKMYITSGFNLRMNSHFFLFVIIEPCDFSNFR
jgi:hypothetical protein